MVNGVLEGLSREINRIFGDGYEIYKEDVEQGLNEPCFLITSLLSQKTNLSSSWSKRERAFMIQYFPKESLQKKTECWDIGDKLLNELEYIEYNGTRARCSDMSFEVVDEVLQFSLSCNTFVTKNMDKDKMQEIDIKERVREN